MSLKKATRMEQRCVIKFCYRMNYSLKETTKLMSEAYGDDRISYKTINAWYKMFKSGRETCNNLEKSGAPKTATTAEVIEAISETISQDPVLGPQDLALMLSISRSSAHRILQVDLAMMFVCSHWVPSVLSDEIRSLRLNLSQRLREEFESLGEPFLSKVLVAGETWMYCWEERQASVPSTPVRPRSRTLKYKNIAKVPVIVFFDADSVIDVRHCEVNMVLTSTDYESMLNDLTVNYSHKKWRYFYDISRCFAETTFNNNFSDLNLIRLPCPPNSHDLTPFGFFLRPKIKNFMLKANFDTKDSAVTGLTNALQQVPNAEFKMAMFEWKNRWERCIASKGDYLID
ncbi:hypothetical protein LSTR_LSTR006923 [Laodelphax striatellus]|uniref:Mos1 transposase HTH domain-containing protein n=1 Tax=Laodelphax striatellus TaxID=195883 RepID=A0A482WT23_LAOST|nr:hypothetical protein LSTR_LSTR017671 [Laodelphax striatellus]RZF40314.1 hypothetical protein LSTR_LSTR006923 [Laodelphax striatellus]